jgi:hypothetical protein
MVDRAFTDALKDIRNGASVVELGETLTGLVERVRATGKAGTLTYTLKVKPASKGDTDVLLLEDDIKVKLPVDTRGGTIYYADDNQQLTRKDPRQPSLPNLREVAQHTPKKDALKEAK